MHLKGEKKKGKRLQCVESYIGSTLGGGGGGLGQRNVTRNYYSKKCKLEVLH